MRNHTPAEQEVRHTPWKQGWHKKRQQQRSGSRYGAGATFPWLRTTTTTNGLNNTITVNRERGGAQRFHPPETSRVNTSKNKYVSLKILCGGVTRATPLHTKVVHGQTLGRVTRHQYLATKLFQGLGTPRADGNRTHGSPSGRRGYLRASPCFGSHVQRWADKQVGSLQTRQNVPCCVLTRHRQPPLWGWTLEGGATFPAKQIA